MAYRAADERPTAPATEAHRALLGAARPSPERATRADLIVDRLRCRMPMNRTGTYRGLAFTTTVSARARRCFDWTYAIEDGRSGGCDFPCSYGVEGSFNAAADAARAEIDRLLDMGR